MTIDMSDFNNELALIRHHIKVTRGEMVRQCQDSYTVVDRYYLRTHDQDFGASRSNPVEGRLVEADCGAMVSAGHVRGAHGLYAHLTPHCRWPR
jgi:hypothetical protein